MSNIKKPNFFIIGAPKCGTTALSEYLRGHPDVFFSNPKEPDYFNTDYSKRKRKFLNEEEYLKGCFSGSLNYKAVGEGSLRYLHSKEAVSNILEFNSDAKFIVMLRDPVDMYLSLHRSQSLSGLWEDISCPEKAWRAQEERKEGKNVPRFCSDPNLLQYGEVCKTGEQLERLYNLVSKDKVLVIFFDDLKKDTRREYQRVLQFLNLPDDGHDDFSVINKRKETRSHALNSIFRNCGILARGVGIKSSFGMRKLLKRINTKRGSNKKPQISSEFRKELAEYFNKDVDKLSNLTGRDLSHWLQS